MLCERVIKATATSLDSVTRVRTHKQDERVGGWGESNQELDGLREPEEDTGDVSAANVLFVHDAHGQEKSFLGPLLQTKTGDGADGRHGLRD